MIEANLNFVGDVIIHGIFIGCRVAWTANFMANQLKNFLENTGTHSFDVNWSFIDEVTVKRISSDDCRVHFIREESSITNHY